MKLKFKSGWANELSILKICFRLLKIELAGGFEILFCKFRSFFGFNFESMERSCIDDDDESDTLKFLDSSLISLFLPTT
jgi:hypothetical protein